MLRQEQDKHLTAVSERSHRRLSLRRSSRVANFPVLPPYEPLANTITLVQAPLESSDPLMYWLLTREKLK